MENKILIYKAQNHKVFKKSPLYALSMAAQSFGLSAEYLAKATMGQTNVAVTDYYIERFWKINFRATGTSLYVSGRENLKENQTYVFMSNHESWMDIPAMFGAAPPSLRMISKAGLMKMPIFGPAMEKAGFIAIDRQNRSKAIKQLEIAKERLLSGISIWIAPEGTRTRNGSIGEFKKGGFYLARELEKPIVPVFIEGARQVMQADSMMVSPNRSITVHFCPPISTQGFDKSHTKDLINLVRDAIIKKQKDSESKS